MSAAESSQPDYSAQIKQEIEREVRALVGCLSEDIPKGWRLDQGVALKPEVVELGSTLTLHRGKVLYSTGDTIAGIPVKVVHYPPRTISVYQFKVDIVDCRDSLDQDTVDLYASITV